MSTQIQQYENTAVWGHIQQYEDTYIVVWADRYSSMRIHMWQYADTDKAVWEHICSSMRTYTSSMRTHPAVWEHTYKSTRNILWTDPVSTFGERRLKKKTCFYIEAKKILWKFWTFSSYYFLKYNEMSPSFLALILNSTNSDEAYLWYIYIHKERGFYMYVYMHMCVCVCVYIYIYMYVCMYICIYVCMYVYMCVCVYIYTYIS